MKKKMKETNENKENQVVVVMRNDKKEKRKATPSMYEFSNNIFQSNLFLISQDLYF